MGWWEPPLESHRSRTGCGSNSPGEPTAFCRKSASIKRVSRGLSPVSWSNSPTPFSIMHPESHREFSYDVHGLRLKSDVQLSRIEPLPGCHHSRGPDVEVRRGRSLERPESETTLIDASEETVHIRSRFGTLTIGQNRVKMYPLQEVEYRSLFSYYAVYVLGFLLHHREFLTLHASAVEVDGGAVAFIGPKGMGKSTTASVFYERGHRILSDDMVACRPCREETPRTDPGFPWMKLGDKALRGVLGRDGDDLERSVPGSSKRIVPIHGQQPGRPLPLRHIYVLGYHEETGQDVEIEPVDQKQACLLLLSQSFVQMFLGESAGSQHLDQCAALSRRVPVSALARPRSMDALPSVYGAVRRDLETTRSTGEATASLPREHQA